MKNGALEDDYRACPPETDNVPALFPGQVRHRNTDSRTAPDAVPDTPDNAKPYIPNRNYHGSTAVREKTDSCHHDPPHRQGTQAEWLTYAPDRRAVRQKTWHFSLTARESRKIKKRPEMTG